MSKREKLRRRLRNNPYDVTFQDLETLLLRFNFVLDRVSGSHHIYRYTQDEQVSKVIIPRHGNKVKPIYVQRVLNLLDTLFPEIEDAADDTPDDN